MAESAMRVYEASSATRLVREFYEKTCETTEGTRKSFEQIGVELTRCALDQVPLLRERGSVESIYVGAVARGGFGVLRPPTLRLLEERAGELKIPLKTFALGLKRSHEPTKEVAEVYLNTLEYAKPDLSSSLVLVYEMGEATGSTVEGAVKALMPYNLCLKRFIFLVGAACIEQTRGRLEAAASDMTLIVGSRWRFIEEPGPSQYYLTKMRSGVGWLELHPRDWGDCVSGMDSEAGVKSFIDFMGEAVKLSSPDQSALYKRWTAKLAKN